ncbi:MAG TPA: hypothetical protein VGC80_11790 [Acetobacteraceae bacterium]
MRSMLIAAAMTAALAQGPALAFDGWHLQQATVIPGPGAAWDYVTLDEARGRLFIGHRSLGLQVFDLASRRLLATVEGTPAASSNGAVLMPEFDLGISNNENGTVTPFTLSTLEARPAVKLGDELDTSHYDPGAKRILVNMAPGKEATDAAVLDVPSLAVAGTIRVPSRKLEGGEGDGAGAFFLAARDVDKVFRMDLKAMRITAEWPAPGCAQTNSLALDVAHRRIMLGCRGSETEKPSFAVMDADTGKVVFTAEIGGGNDGLVYDAATRRVFLANGVGAVLNVFEQLDADHYRPVETLGTRAGVRSLAMDRKAGTLHSVVAEGSADAGKKILTSVSPFYANTFFPDSFTVLTYGRN